MSIEKRAERYYVRWREGGKQRSKSFSRLEDARRHETERRRQAEMGAHTPATASRQSFGEWLAEWEQLFSAEWSASTREGREYTVEMWIRPYLGHVPMREIGGRRIRAWRGEIRKAGASANTANAALRVLSAACGAAVGMSGCRRTRAAAWRSSATSYPGPGHCRPARSS